MKKKLVYKGKFARAMKGRKISSGGLTVFVATGTGLSGGKVGFAVKKGIKGAVKRNRIKRALREYARKMGWPLPGRTLILIAADERFSKKPVKLDP